ncbi:VOC family protein [Macrococcus brunensis]|uniref:VOC family protein n=1 Tax=Macrococcus brunensis TaxID=198483 RepID=UPI001EF0639B|nr:VOC family protein [Macrococcus brunensis]ULG72188.1 hypothetical protein MGG12_01275 [Macrococcus brunensis]
MKFNTLIPKLEVSNIETSKNFYIDVLGFKLEYERKEDKFVFLSKDGSQLMLEETVDDELEYPYGRGMNLTFTKTTVGQLSNLIKE